MWDYHQTRMKALLCGVLLVIVQSTGCVGQCEDSFEKDFSALRGKTLRLIRDRVEKLDKDFVFCCRVIEGWPNKDPAGLMNSLDYPNLGVVKPNGEMVKASTNSSHDGGVGKKLLGLISRCTMDDVFYVGALRKLKVHTAGLFWLGRDGSRFSGISVVTEENVYFVYTRMYFLTNVEDGYGYDLFWATPPYYILRNPYGTVLLEMQDAVAVINERFKKTYQDQRSYDDACFDHLVTAFRIDITPAEFLSMSFECK